MLDVQTYRMFEELARSSMAHWMTGHRHLCQGSFPVTMLPQTRAVIDGMQEFRFDDYQRELGGFNQTELSHFVGLAKETIEFQESTFPNLPHVLPNNALITALLVYYKIQALKPSFASLLEIGPGSGYQSFVLRHLHPSLQLYAQVEANDAFYLLQHLINQHVFGREFQERVYPTNSSFSDFYEGEKHGIYSYFSSRADITTLDVPRPIKRMVHYPWWRIGAIPSDAGQFDVVMSNANLLEFSPIATDDYLKLIHTVLAPDGVLFIHDFGGGPRGGPAGIPEALTRLYESGFAPVFLALSGQMKGDPRWLAESHFLQIDAFDQRHFRLGNSVFIREGHELFPHCYKQENFRDFFVASHPGLQQAFFADRHGRRFYERAELAAMVKELWVREISGS